MEALEKLFEIVRPLYLDDDPSHDFAHILRVIENAKKINKYESAEEDILIPAALMHDLINIPKKHSMRSLASEKSSLLAKKILKGADYDELSIDKICTVILEHSFSRGLKPSSIESAILQDADKLDALGAIGIMRTVSCGTRFKAKYYQQEDPFCKNRDLDDKSFIIDHFYKKLFKLPEMMNTQTGKEEAFKRVEFMKYFLEQLDGEIR